MIVNAISRIANSALVSGPIENIVNTPGYAGKFAVGTNVVKDAINCGVYVYQSLHNEKIPEDKRKFVAALDLVNGVLMCITQAALGFTISNRDLQKSICGKLFGAVRANKGLFAACSIGFEVFSSLVVSTVVAKRLIVPFISTPLAAKFKSKFLDKDCKKQTDSEAQNTDSFTKKDDSVISKLDNMSQSAGNDKIKRTYAVMLKGLDRKAEN